MTQNTDMIERVLFPLYDIEDATGRTAGDLFATALDLAAASDHLSLQDLLEIQNRSIRLRAELELRAARAQRAISSIVAVLNVEEDWSADTLDTIGRILTGNGYKIESAFDESPPARRARPARDNLEWTADDDGTIHSRVRYVADADAAAAMLQRSRGAVLARAVKLGLLTPMDAGITVPTEEKCIDCGQSLGDAHLDGCSNRTDDAISVYPEDCEVGEEG